MLPADAARPEPLWRRGARILGTVAVVGFAAGLGVAGHAALSERVEAAGGVTLAPLNEVRAERLRLNAMMQIERRFTGQFEARQETALAFEEGGTLAEVLVREGDAVVAGAVLARIDTRLLEAERARLEAQRQALLAQAELARRTNERQGELQARGHAAQARIDETSLRLAQLTAGLAEIDAALVTVSVRLEKALLRAPFAGRVGSRFVDTGAIVSPGATVATLLEDGPARFRVTLDPGLAVRLDPGAGVDIAVGDALLPATLSRLAPELDPVTRGRVAVFDLADGVTAPPARSTGEVILADGRDMTGAWVPLSALRPGLRGTWTILTVAPGPDGDAIIAQDAVEVLQVAEGRVFLRGGFVDGDLFLPDGTHRVVPGQRVRVAE